MCGIAGIVDFEAPAARHVATVRRMVARLGHRGPDGARVEVHGDAVLGHAQLAIRDPGRSAQPMPAPGGGVLVYNGELYDDAAARPPGFAPRTAGDTELVAAACEAWGLGALPRLEGMFALAYWEPERRGGFLARDVLGVKPLFVHREGARLAFASEPDALAEAIEGPPALALRALLAHWTLPPFGGVAEGLRAGVEVLPAGHALELDRRGARLVRWGRFVPAEEGDVDAEALVGEAREALARSVRATARPVGAHAPFGVLLSGGLDSTAVAALAREAHPELPAYVLRYTGAGAFDADGSRLTGSEDAPFAREAAAALGLRRDDVEVGRDAVDGALARVAAEDGQLPAFAQQLSQRHLFDAAARDGRRIVLVGDAADETWFGYHFLLDPITAAGPAGFLERFGARRRLALVRAELVGDLDPYGAAVAAHQAIATEAGATWDGGVGSIRATTALIVARWLPRLLWNGDVHAMRASIEARVPFANPSVLRVAARVPPSLGLRGGEEKHVLRRAVPGAVPASIRRRRKSALPADHGAAARYRALARAAVRRGAPVLDALFDPDALGAFLARPPADEVDRAMLFGLASLAAFSEARGLERLR